AASTPYAWRVRVASTGPVITRHSRWLSIQGNGPHQTDVRTGSVVLSAPAQGPTATEQLLSSIHPNPTTSSVRIELNLRGEQSVGLDVFDIVGRHVRRITSASGAVTGRVLTWDLRDDRGLVVVP